MRKFIITGLVVVTGAIAIPSAAMAAWHNCGHGIIAGNNTSCGIARNADTVWHRDCYGDVRCNGWLYSPARRRNYSVDWTFNSWTNRATVHVHTAGNPWASFYGLYE